MEAYRVYACHEEIVCNVDNTAIASTIQPVIGRGGGAAISHRSITASRASDARIVLLAHKMW